MGGVLEFIPQDNVHSNVHCVVETLSQSCMKSFLREHRFSSHASYSSYKLLWPWDHQGIWSPLRACLGTWGTGWDFRIAAVNPPSNPSLSLHYFLITDLLVLRLYVPHSSRVSLLKFQLHHHRALVKKSFNAFPSWLWKKSRRPPMATDLTGITLPALQTHSLTFFVLLTSVM